MDNILDILLPYQRDFFLNTKKRKIWISSRQVGKSFTLAGILAFKALSRKNGLSLCISTGARAAAEIIRKCEQFAQAVKKLSNGMIDYTTAYDSVKFSNGSRILSLPGSTDGANLRGFSAQCVAIDEAAFIPHIEEIVQGIAPTLTRDPDAELLFTSTPAGKNSWLYKKLLEAQHDPEWHIQQTTIHDAIRQGLNIDIQSLHSLCPDPDRFAQEYECEWMSEYDSFIDTELIDWYDEEPEGIDGRYLGMDIGSRQDRSAITTLLTKGGCAYLSDIAILNKVEYERQLEIVKELNEKHHYTAGLIDETGIGSAFAAFVTKNVSSLLKGMSFTATNKTPMYERLRSMIFQHKLYINRKLKPLIIQDFNNVERVVTESGKVQYIAGHDENGHSDATSSLVLALEAWHQRPVQMQMPSSWSYRSRF